MLSSRVVASRVNTWRSVARVRNVRGFHACVPALKSDGLPSKLLPQHNPTFEDLPKPQKFNGLPKPEDYRKSSILNALHKRLKLPESYELSTLSRALNCRSAKNNLPTNEGMALFGKNLLEYHVSEHLLSVYPRLPPPILKAAIDSYISTEVLYSIAINVWGLEVDNVSEFEKYIDEHDIRYSLGQIRYKTVRQPFDAGVTIVAGKNQISPANAFATAVRAIIGGYYASTKNEQLTKQFIRNYILSRKLDVDKIFYFQRPSAELTKLCLRENLGVPVKRLLAESGRHSSSSIFVVGTFTENGDKLGESYGTSIREATVRSEINALKNWYLYRPLNPTVPTDDDYVPSIIDHGLVI